MGLYDLMREFAAETKIKTDSSTPTPALGFSLSLFHSGLLEWGLNYDGPEEKPMLTAAADEIDTTNLSYFIVAFLPFNSVTKKEEINHVLFDVYSFFKWLDKKEIGHGLANINLMKLMKDLCSMQERCLKISHLLDSESGRVLEDLPEIVHTVNDVFSVVKIENDGVHLKGRREKDIVCLSLPSHILPLLKLNDSMDLVLGDTSEKWVVLEAGQVFPSIPAQKLS